MGTNYNPKIVTDGLVLYLDPANLKSNKGRRSLINWNSWIAGTVGSATGYNQNGDGNSRILDTNPFGNQDVIWDVSNQDAASDADGGWNSSYFPIDNTKMYRFSVWIRRKVIGNGSYYLGTWGLNGAAVNVGVLERNGGINNTNPYWFAGGWGSLAANTWYLFVGHVFPQGSGTGANHPDSGAYDTSGTKIINVSRDYVWRSDNVFSLHRSYLYYSTDITTNQQFYQPRVDLCDGSEPTIAELLADVGNKFYDLSSNGNLGTLTSTNTANIGVTIDNNNLGSFVFDGQYAKSIKINNNPSTMDFSQAQTICIWMKPGTGNSSARRNPYNQAYGGEGTITQEPGGNFNYYFGTNGGNSHPYYSIGSNFSVGDNELAFITVSRNQSTNTSKWYKNGVLVSTGTAAGYAATTNGLSPIYIGDGYTNEWIGNMYNIAVYNRALTDDEVAQNFNAHRGRHGI